MSVAFLKVPGEQDKLFYIKPRNGTWNVSHYARELIPYLYHKFPDETLILLERQGMLSQPSFLDKPQYESRKLYMAGTYVNLNDSRHELLKKINYLVHMTGCRVRYLGP